MFLVPSQNFILSKKIAFFLQAVKLHKTFQTLFVFYHFFNENPFFASLQPLDVATTKQTVYFFIKKGWKSPILLVISAFLMS